jgi:DNA helicase-2/ATP-dependent DNA helicase PcrA
VLGARPAPDGAPEPAALLRDPDLLPASWPWRHEARRRIEQLAQLLHEARLRWDLLGPGDYIEWLWRAGGLLQTAWPDETADARLVLRRLQRDADAWEEAHPGAGIAGWAALLEHNIREQPRVALPTPPAADAVLVATVHQAKGQEWPVVFVYSTQLPSRRAGSIDSVLWDEHWKLVISGGARDETLAALRADLRRRQRNEERSIWYVALTRARERLFVLHSGCVYDGGFADAAAKLARAAAGEPPAPEDEAVHFFHEMWELLGADQGGLGAIVERNVVGKAK